MQFQKPVLVQQQKLKLSPQLYQSIQLMALPIQDLKIKINEELEKNPALELVSDGPDEQKVPEKKQEEWDPFENSSDPGYLPVNRQTSREDTKRQFLEGAVSRKETLQDHLLFQLRVQPLTEKQVKIGELLIENLDSDGFHLEQPETLVQKSEISLLPSLLSLIRKLDPPGTCCRDYSESLIVQAGNTLDCPKSVLMILENHLNLLMNRKESEILKIMKISHEEFDLCFKFIQTLNPFPGRQYNRETPNYIIPDLIVEKRDGQFILKLNDEEIPVLDVNPFFDDLQQQKNSTKEVNQFVSNKVKDARWFIRSIDQRNTTLAKAGRTIMEFQRDFFRQGPKYLRPLTLKDIAVEIGVHEATVSRITSGKYIQTEWGLLELKYFFSNSISGAGSSGSSFSKEGVKETIREIIQEYTAVKKLSDQKIADMLAQKGINIARRTVAKYRKELDIDSSYRRF